MYASEHTQLATKTCLSKHYAAPIMHQYALNVSRLAMSLAAPCKESNIRQRTSIRWVNQCTRWPNTLYFVNNYWHTIFTPITKNVFTFTYAVFKAT